jgi:hypothetical protein
MVSLSTNPGKQLTIMVNQTMYERYPIKTRVIHNGDDLLVLLQEYAQPHLKPGDIIFISEKIVAITSKLQAKARPLTGF